jgi:small subunit ribosomal protein S16
MLSIRLRRAGSTKRPYFRVVVTEARSKADGRSVERLGTYNPRSKPAEVLMDAARVRHWLERGARPSDSVRTLLGRHLSRDLSVPVETAVAE